jgi:hypothetical protein
MDIVKKSGVKLHEYKDMIVPEDYFSEAQVQLAAVSSATDLK